MTVLNNLPEVKSKPAFGYDETDVETKTFTGGKPYVNDSFTYPVDKDNKPLRFFCQLDLSEVDERVKKYLNLPDTGFLQFYHGDEDVFGMDFDNKDFSENVSRILYLEEAFDDPNFVVPDNEGEDNTPLDENGSQRVYYAGEYVDLLPFPNSNDNPSITEEDKYGEAYTEYYDFVNETNYELYLGGYPHFTQWDFRDDDNELVLLLGSESGDNVLWGDMGAGGFWVPQKDLQEQKYDNSVIFWDCL